MEPSPGLAILHVVPYYEQAWAYGGIPRVAAALARGLVRRGHRVTVCTTDACEAGRRLSRTAAERDPAGVEVRVFRNLSNHAAYRLQLFTPVGLASYLRRHAADFDVAHLHGCHHLPGALAARELSRRGVPYLLTPNGTAGRIERRRAWKLLFDHTVGRHVLSGAARVLAVSESERRSLLALGVPAERLRLLPNAVDLDELEPAPARGRLRARLALGDRPLVLYLGKLTPRKQVETLVEAFAALGGEARLVIAGNDMGMGRKLRRLLRRVERRDGAIFTGLLRGRERLEALADADVVVYASRDEAFGLVPVEALLCGTPVVVGDDAGCGEVIGATGGGLLVPPGDAGALTAALRRILAAPGAFRLAASRAASRVRERFGQAAVCARLLELYDEVTPRGRRRVA
jgi:glycosyltransferase involved in cell wall biosynthesis